MCTPSAVLVHSCGLHGVEGYAGSAIQRNLLKDATFLEHLAALQPGQMVIIAHALNPHGMAWRERFNENNVDLNRNCLAKAGSPAEDAAKFANLTSQPFAEYTELDGLINPPDIGCCDCFAAKAGCTIMRYGIPHLKRATVSGQYIKQAGIFYGGAALQESVSIFLRQIWSLGVSRENANLSSLTHIDVHTGLGSPGQEALLIGPGSPTALLRACVGVLGEGASAEADRSQLKVQPTETEGLSYPVVGNLTAAVSLLAGPLPESLLRIAVPASRDNSGAEEFEYPPLSDSKEQQPSEKGPDNIPHEASSPVGPRAAATDSPAELGGARVSGAATARGSECVKLCMAQEFGTQPPVKVLQALRALNAALYGASAQAAVRANVPLSAPERQAVLDAFFVDCDQWKQDILSKGRKTFFDLFQATFDPSVLRAHLAAAGVEPTSVLPHGEAQAQQPEAEAEARTAEAGANSPPNGVPATAVASTQISAPATSTALDGENSVAQAAEHTGEGNNATKQDDVILTVVSSATQGSIASADMTTV